MQVHVVGPEAWRGVLDTALEESGPQTAAQARALLRHAHNNHVGLTANAAIALVQLLDQGRLVARGSSSSRTWPWDLVMERLVGSLGGNVDSGSGRRKGLLLRSVPGYAVLQLALPLVELACERLGESYLFGDAGHSVPADFGRSYRAYQTDLGQILAELAEDEEFESFYAQWALMAQGLSRQHIRRSRGTVSPDADGLVHALIERIDPSLERDHLNRETYRPRAIRHMEDRRGERPKEDGVTGIRNSRHLDDVPDMLWSQLALPEELLLDKLVNTGLLVRHRPPPLDKRRDMLFFGVMPKGWDEALAPLAKACWFDAALRVAILLRKCGLERSDFVWVEGDPMGGVRGAAVPLELAPVGRSTRSIDVTPTLRRGFLGALDWLPGFLDSHCEYRTDLPAFAEVHSVLPRIHDSVPEDDPRIPCRWLPRALRAMLGRHRPARSATSSLQEASREASREPALDLDSYALVYGTVLLPALPPSNAGEPLLRGLGFLRYSLGLETSGARCLSPVWLPVSMKDFAGWQYLDRFGNEVGYLPPVWSSAGDATAGPPETAQSGTGFVNAVAGALIGHWLSGVEDAVFGE